jgi:PAS domain S-box-containing protein
MGIHKPNGVLTWVSVNAEPVFYSDGATPDAVVSTLVDITQQKQQAKALRYIEARYRALFENIIDATYVLSPYTGRILDCNPAAARMTGYTIAELKQMTMYDLHPPATQAVAAAKLREVVKKGTIREISGIYHRRKDGGLVPIEINANRLVLGDDVVVMVAVHETSQRVKAETALKESEERFNLAIQGANDGLWDWNLETQQVYFSPRWKSMLGYQEHELEHHLDVWQRLLHPADSALVRGKFNACIAGQTDRLEIEFRMKHRDGHWVNILSRAFKQFNNRGQPVRLVGMHVDLTPLRQVEAQLRRAQEIARLGYYVFNIETGQWTSSDILDDIFAIGPAYQRDVPGWLNIIHPDFREIMNDYLADEILTHHHSFDKEYKIITIDSGQERWVHGLGELAFNEAGQLIRMFGAIQDITARKLAEEARRETEARYQGIFENVAASIIIVDHNGAITDVNSYHLSHISKGQRTKADFIGQNLLERPSLKSAGMSEVYARVLRGTPIDEKGVYFPELTGGWGGYFNVKGVPFLRDNQVVGAIYTLEDVTELMLTQLSLRESNTRLENTLIELKATQAKMVQNERLAAVGQLAAGIAHDFNNILTSILGHAELIQMTPNLPQPTQKQVANIISPAKHAAHLVQQILDFSRKSMRQTKLFNLTTLSQETLSFLRHTIPENIHLNLRFGLGPYMIKADPTQMQQIITNLIINARDAMPTGGEIRFELTQVNLDSKVKCATCNLPMTGPWICLTITDTGEGISPEVMPHIFEPFFTTREVGKGSGLGLPQVYGIIKQHNGHIIVSSQPGHGAGFTIYLPPALPPALANPQPVDKALVRSQQGETILVVEDEPGVLEVTTAILKYAGYEVLTAQSGQRGIEIYRQQHDRIALVISDMDMPDMKGTDMCRILKAQNPDLKLIMMSGYPLGNNETELLEQGALNWMQKPVSMQRLTEVVSLALSGG